MTRVQEPGDGSVSAAPPAQPDRVQLEISRETHERLLRVQHRAGARSPDEVLRWVLDAYACQLALAEHRTPSAADDSACADAHDFDQDIVGF